MPAKNANGYHGEKGAAGARLACPHKCGYHAQNEPALLSHLRKTHPAPKGDSNLPAPGTSGMPPRSDGNAPMCRIYVRVSTDDQENENQILRLKAALGIRGWLRFKLYQDKDSGTKRNRPGLMLLLSELHAGDVFVILRADRLSRSLMDFVEITGLVQKAGAEIWCIEQPVDTTSSMGKAFWQILGVFAELEHGLIMQRTRDGLDRARAQGKWLGRHKTGCGIEFRCPWGMDHSAAAVAMRREKKKRGTAAPTFVGYEAAAAKYARENPDMQTAQEINPLPEGKSPSAPGA